jgi:hypothetical protein
MWVILLLYVAGTVQIDNLHQLLHHHTVELHSEQAEKDPCHRSVFHHEQNKGCEHKTHVTQTKECFVQQLLGHTFHITIPQQDFFITSNVADYQLCFFTSVEETIGALRAARAPPQA